MKLDARKLGFQRLNEQVRAFTGDIEIENCFGERFIGAAAGAEKRITVRGTPGNALGCYLDGAEITVHGNAQDAVGDTMNEGRIVVHGSAGDALGYAMRGGRIFIRGDSGYRTGIHMKQYEEKCPAIVVGGGAGSFLGEYQAGGVIVVLGLDRDLGAGHRGEGETATLTPHFVGTGMHGGKIFLRAEQPPQRVSPAVSARLAAPEDMEEILGLLREFSELFSVPMETLLSKPFRLLTPNARNPYEQLYTEN